MVDFLYFGEANVNQERLNEFLALAEEFRLKGLTGRNEADENDGNMSSRPPIRNQNWRGKDHHIKQKPRGSLQLTQMLDLKK